MKKTGQVIFILFCFSSIENCTIDQPPESFLRELLLLRPCVPYQMGGSFTGCPLNLAGIVTTFAGSTSGYLDAVGTAAQFNGLGQLTSDGDNIYAITLNGHRVRQIEISTGVVSTIAGDGAPGSSNGTGTAATFFNPRGITTDGTFLFVADTGNDLIRKIELSTANVTTLAGSTPGFLDATGTAAQFDGVTGITTDGTFVYVADGANHRIRRIEISTGVVTTEAGSSAGYLDGIGTAAQFNGPRGITTDGSNLFIAEVTNPRIRKIEISTGIVTTIAGDGTPGFLDGPGTAAQFNGMYYMATDGRFLFVVEEANKSVRQVEIATGIVTTLAGDGTSAVQDGTGSAAHFFLPNGVTSDGKNLFIGGAGSNLIRKIE